MKSAYSLLLLSLVGCVPPSQNAATAPDTAGSETASVSHVLPAGPQPWIQGGWPDSRRPGENLITASEDKYFKLVNASTKEYKLRNYPLEVGKRDSIVEGVASVISPWGNEIYIGSYKPGDVMIDLNFARAEEREFVIPN
jgi:hypothetical protein